MSVQAVNTNTVPQQKKTGGSGKAWASVFIPGLGQFLDGRNAAGAGYMGAGIATGIGSFALRSSLAKDIFKASSEAVDDAAFDITKYLSKIPKGKLYGSIALGLAATGLWIANIVDAYKGDKKKV